MNNKENAQQLTVKKGLIFHLLCSYRGGSQLRISYKMNLIKRTDVRLNKEQNRIYSLNILDVKDVMLAIITGEECT